MGKEFRGGKKGGNRGGNRGSGRGGNRGRGRGGIGSRGMPKIKERAIPHRFEGVYILTGKGGKAEEALVTKNLSPGESVYGEKRITIDENTQMPDGMGDQVNKVEYRVWNPFRSKLGAAIVNGIGKIYMKPGSKVLYLGAANGTTISHVSDLVGEKGIVYGVEISERSGRDLLNMAKKRPNLVPIIDDARKPQNYRFLIPQLVDCIFADVAQPDQSRIIAINAEHFLQNNGGFVYSVKANCIDSTAKPEDVFDQEIKTLKKYSLYAKERVTLEPYERGHAVLTGLYKPFKKKKEEKEEKEEE